MVISLPSAFTISMRRCSDQRYRLPLPRRQRQGTLRCVFPGSAKTRWRSRCSPRKCLASRQRVTHEVRPRSPEASCQSLPRLR
ncbi:hypothetical protein CUR178_03446 [Leishmania enriettii]|uniref:Uncharacterized protein n=1 Tax=Leishmania enriettii TaxID=5663 RepID=A0A836HN73_LEIEN|nr:hypothetical protein CUR178_03446 [Leishmania enriettii]